MIDDLFASFDGAFSQNTIRAYRSDWIHYECWCEERDLTPLPATADNLAAYIKDMSVTLKAATIRRRIDSLSSIFTLSKNPNPTHEPEVILAIKRMHRQLGRTQKQAEPLTREYLDKMKTRCRNSAKGLRDKLILQLGYETMRRRAELCRLRLEDVRKMPKGKYALLLRFSKTDQYGEGTWIPISETLYTLIQRWKKRIGEKEGYILRSVSKDGKVGESLRPDSIVPILVDLQHRARLRDLPRFSGHSMRVGAALDLLEKGVPLEKIMLRGGWSTKSTTLRYLAAWSGASIDVYD
ncbi:MAG: integrase [Marinobacter sp. T13-3]|nr:MAG: integrase [Marinobacter sp. T13-3]